MSRRQIIYEKYNLGKNEDYYPEPQLIDDEYIQKHCDIIIDNFNCVNNWKIIEIVFNILELRIYKVLCLETNKIYILKYTINRMYDVNKLKKEISMQNYLAGFGLAPEVLKAWTYEPKAKEDHTFIIMEPMKEVISSLLDKYSDFNVRKKILKSYLTLMYKLHSLNIYHGDIHNRNIMVTYKTPSYKEIGKVKTEMQLYNLYKYQYKLIDFENTRKITKKETYKSLFDKEVKSFIVIYGLIDEYNSLYKK